METTRVASRVNLSTVMPTILVSVNKNGPKRTERISSFELREGSITALMSGYCDPALDDELDIPEDELAVLREFGFM